MCKRIAMWSGPRNLSTALMRSFASRSDCEVLDEPFYACYLDATGYNHPMRANIIRTQETDFDIIMSKLCAGKIHHKIQYQKHMAHHMLDHWDRSFIEKLTNVFLIRSPKKVVRSLGLKLNTFDPKQTGFIQQFELFQLVAEKSGSIPAVISADDINRSPEKALRAICAAIGIEFIDSMLKWTLGPHTYDGIWGKHWYKKVNASTSFVSDREENLELSREERNMVKVLKPFFEELEKHKLVF